MLELGIGQEIPGTDYKIAGIEGVANVEGTYYEMVDSQFSPIGFAVLDNEASNTDNLIVVGGWNANDIAKKIKEANPEIESELEQDKKIVEKFTVDGQEMILVAGWEAPDTRAAAEDFINWLQSNVQ
jgi:S-layer protein (TIGR01564 family)